MWTRKSSKSKSAKDDAPAQSSRRKDASSRSRSDSKTSSPPKKSSSSRGDDRDRGIERNLTDYPSTSQELYTNGGAPSVASSYATAAMNPTDYQTISPALTRSNTFPEQTSSNRDRRDDNGSEGLDYRKERRSDRGQSREEGKKSRSSDDRDENRRERRERRERKMDSDLEKNRGISRSDTYPPSASRGPGDFSAQVHSSGFTQFPGQYDGGFVGGPSSRPQHHEPLSSHVPDQFPGQFPVESSGPYRPPLAKNEGGPGLASEYYGDSGQSVQDQPGVRPQPPSLIIGSEPHLQAASAVEAPPPEPSSMGQTGAAASFYNSAEDFGPSSGPARPTQQLGSSQAPAGGYPAAAPLAGAVAAGMVASNATFTQSNSHYSHETSYQSRPSNPAPSIAPSNTTYYSTSTNINPMAGAAGAAAAGAAAGYALGHQSSSSSQAPQVPMMSGALNSSQQSSYQAIPPSSRPPANTQQSSTVNPVFGAVGAAAAGAAAGYLLGNHSSSSNQGNAQSSISGSFQSRPSDQRPPPQPLSHHQNSESFTGDVHASYIHESSHANGNAPQHSSNAALYTAGLAGAAGLAAASMHNGHQNNHYNDHQNSQHDSFSYSHGSMAQQHHRKYHQHQGPLDKFVDFWRDSYAVGQYEEYTEYIGVCRYCFSPGSSPRDAPRRHHYGRRKSSYERLNAASRVSKDYRRYSSSSESERDRRTKNNSWLAAGLGAYGLGTMGKKLFAANHGFDDTYSVQSGKPTGSSSKERRSYSEARYTNIPGSYPGDERQSGFAAAAVKNTSADDTGLSRTYEQTRRSRPRSRDRELGLDTFQTTSFEASLKQRHRSRSRSRDRKAAIVGTAAGAAAAGTVVASLARNRRSPERRDGNYPHHPSVGYVEVRRDGRHEHGQSSLSHHRSDLVEVGSRKDDRHNRSHSSSPSRRKKKTKKTKGFFSFSNSSSSSADSTLAFGGDSVRRKPKKDTHSRKKSSDKTDAAILGLGAAAAAIALQQSHQNGKGKPRTDAPSLTKPHQIYAADGRKDSHGRYGHHHGPDADGWESASDNDHSSIDSMLAYGMSRRSSRESLRSNSSGMEKWNWRWGGEKKSKKQRHYDSSVPALGAVAAGAIGGAIAAEKMHKHEEQGHPIGSNTSLLPMQHVYPSSTGDPTAFDATRHNSTISPSQPLTTVRPSPLPLQQPQPISQVSTTVLTSMAPLDHSYSAPTGSVVYNPIYQPQNAQPRVLPSAILAPGQGPMPGSFPPQTNVPYDIQPVIKEISPRRRASTPPDPSKSSRDAIGGSTGIDVPPNVRFNLTQEDEDRERREKRQRRKEEKARRAEVERLEKQQQAEIDEAERSVKRAAQQSANRPHAMPDKYDSPPRQERNDHQWRSERRSRSDSHPAMTDQTSSWVAPTLAGAAGAAIGAAIIHEIEPRRKDRYTTGHDDKYEDVEQHKDYHHDDKYQEVYQRVIHDHEQSEKVSREELSEEERRAEKKRAKFAREAARRISRTPSPVYNHEKYSDFFQLPLGTLEAAREPEEEEKFYGKPDADNDILRYRVLPPKLVMKADQKAPEVVYNTHGELMDSSRMMPWRVKPMLNLVEPTPPGSIAGSVRGDASPIIHAQDEPEVVTSKEIEEPAKEVPKQRSASKVRFGDNVTQEYDVVTPESHREEFIESNYKPLKRNYAEGSTRSIARSPSPEEVVTEDHPRHEHMPGEFGDDIDFTATVAAGLEDSGFPSSIVVDDPSFRRRGSPPGSDGEGSGSGRRDIGSVYQKPFYETVTDLGQHVPLGRSDPPHNEAKGTNVMDFLIEEPTEHMVEIKPKGDAKTKDTAKKRSLRDVIGLVGAAGATSALANAASSSPLTKSREAPDNISDVARAVSPEVERDRAVSPKPRTLKRADSPSPERQASIDSFYDAPAISKSTGDDIRETARPTMINNTELLRQKPEAIPLPIGDDKDLEAREIFEDARIDASEANQMRALGEHEIADILQPEETIPDNDYEEIRKSKKKFKRRSTTEFDETASVVSAPTVIERSPESNGDSKGKSKKERKSSLFGIFSRSSEDVSEKSKGKGKSKTDDFYDYDEPTKKSKKSKGRRSTGDDYDDDVQSRASEPTPAADFEEVSKKGKKGKERRSAKDDFYDDDVLSRASEPAPALEYEEPGKKNKRSKDRKASKSDYDEDTLSRASEPILTMPGLDDAEDDVKSRKRREKDEKRKGRKESKVDREPGRIAQELPAKVHSPAFPAASSSFASKAALLTEIVVLQNGRSDEMVLEFQEDRRRDDSLSRNLDQDQSFLGERQERKKPPDIDYGEPRSTNRESLQRSKDVEAALHTLNEGRPATPESDGNQREVQSTPSHRRRISMLQSSDSFDGNSTPSPTAIPLSFRMGARPASMQLTRSSPDTPTLASIQPDTPKARNKQRPKSGEIRRSTEIRPLFLVEKHSARQEPVFEERYPSLPSSHTTSRASSVHDGGDEEDEVDRLVSREHRKGSYHEQPLGTDLEYYKETDLLDSQQATPTATSFREAGEHMIDQPDVGYQRDRRFSQGEIPRDMPAEMNQQRQSSRAEKVRRRSESFMKNVAWDQLAGGAAALEALRYINTPSTRLHEGESFFEEAPRNAIEGDISRDRPQADTRDSRDQLSQGPAFSAKSFDTLEENQTVGTVVDKADVLQVTAPNEPFGKHVSSGQIELSQPASAIGIEPQIEAEPVEGWSTPILSKKDKKDRKGKKKGKTVNLEESIEPVSSRVGGNKDMVEAASPHRDLSPVEDVDTELEITESSTRRAFQDGIRLTKKPDHAPVLSKDMSTAAVVATMAAAAGAVALDQNVFGKIASVEEQPRETDVQDFESVKTTKGRKRHEQAKIGDWETLDEPEDSTFSWTELISYDIPTLKGQLDLPGASSAVTDTTIFAQDVPRDEPLQEIDSYKKRSSLPLPDQAIVSQESAAFTDASAKDADLVTDSIALAGKSKENKNLEQEKVAFDDFEKTIPSIDDQVREITPLERAPSPRSLALPEGDDLDLEETFQTNLPSDHQMVPHEEPGFTHEMQPTSAEVHVPNTIATDGSESLAREHQVSEEPKSRDLVIGEPSRELSASGPAQPADAGLEKEDDTPFETSVLDTTYDHPLEQAEISIQQETPQTTQDDGYFGFETSKKGKKGKKGRKSQTSTPLEEPVTELDKLAAPLDVVAVKGDRDGVSTPLVSEIADQETVTDDWAPSTNKKKKGKKGRKDQATSSVGDDSVAERSKTDPMDISKAEMRSEEPITLPVHSDEVEVEVEHDARLADPMQTEELIAEEWAFEGKKKGKKSKKGKEQSAPLEEVNTGDEITQSESLVEPEATRDIEHGSSAQGIQAQQPEFDEWAPLNKNKKKNKKGKRNQTVFPPDEPDTPVEETIAPSELLQRDVDQSLDSPSLLESTQISEDVEWAPSNKRKKGKKNKKGSDLLEEPIAGTESTTSRRESPLPEASQELDSTPLSEGAQLEETRTPIFEIESVELASTKGKGKKSKKGKAVALDLSESFDKPTETARNQQDLHSTVSRSLDSDTTPFSQPEPPSLDTLQPSVTSESQENVAMADESASGTVGAQPTSADVQSTEVLSSVETAEPPMPVDVSAPTSKAKGKKGKKGKRTSSGISSPVVDRRQSTDDWMDAALDEPTKFEEPNIGFGDTENVVFDEPEITSSLEPSNNQEVQVSQEIRQTRSMTPTEHERHASLHSISTNESVPEIISDGARMIKDEHPFEYQRPITPEPSESSMIFETPTSYPIEPIHQPPTPGFHRSMSSSTHDSFHEAEEEHEQETPRVRPVFAHDLGDFDMLSEVTPLPPAPDPSNIALHLDERSDFGEEAWHEILGHDVETDLERKLAGGERLQRIVTLDDDEPEVSARDQSEGELGQQVEQGFTPRTSEEHVDQLPVHVLHKADELLTSNGDENATSAAEVVPRALDEDHDSVAIPQAASEHSDQLPDPVLHKADELFSPENDQRASTPVDQGLEQHAESVIPSRDVDEPAAQVPANVLSKADQLLHDPPQEQVSGVLTPPHGFEAHEATLSVRDTPEVQEISTEPLRDIDAGGQPFPDPVLGFVRDPESPIPLANELTMSGTGDPVVPAEEPETFAFPKSKKDKKKSKRAQKMELLEGEDLSSVPEATREMSLEEMATEEVPSDPLTQQTSEEVPAMQPHIEEPTSIERSPLLEGPSSVVENTSSSKMQKSKKEKRESEKTQELDWDEQVSSIVSPDQATQDAFIDSTTASQPLPEQAIEQDKLIARESEISTEPAQEKSINMSQVDTIPATQEPVIAEEVAPDDLGGFSTKRSKKDKKKSKKAKAFDWNEPDVSSSSQATPGTQSLETSTILPSVQTEILAEDIRDVHPSAESAEAGDTTLRSPSIDQQFPSPDERTTSAPLASQKDQRDLDDKQEQALDDTITPTITLDTETPRIADIEPTDQSGKDSLSVPLEEVLTVNEDPLPILEESPYSLKKSKKDKKKSKRAQNLDLDDEPGLASSGILTPVTPSLAEQTITTEGLETGETSVPGEPVAQEQDDFPSLKKSRKDKKKAKRTQALSVDDEPDITSSGILTPDVAVEDPVTNESILPREEPILQDKDDPSGFKTSKKDKKKSKKSKTLDWIDEPQADSPTKPSVLGEPVLSSDPPNTNDDQPALSDEPIELPQVESASTLAEPSAVIPPERPEETSAAADEFAPFSSKKSKKDKKKAKRAQTLDWTEEHATNIPNDREVLDSPLLQETEPQSIDSISPSSAIDAGEDSGTPSKKKGKKDRKKSKLADEFAWADESTKTVPEEATAAEIANDQSQLPEMPEPEPQVENTEIPKEIPQPVFPGERKMEEPEHGRGEVFSEEQVPVGAMESSSHGENTGTPGIPSAEHQESFDVPKPSSVTDYEEGSRLDTGIREPPPLDEPPRAEPLATEVKNEAPVIVHTVDKTDSSTLPQGDDTPSIQPIIEDNYQSSATQEVSGVSAESAPNDEIFPGEREEGFTIPDPQPNVIAPTTPQEEDVAPLEEPTEFSFKKSKKDKKKGKKAQIFTWDESNEVPAVEESSAENSIHQNAKDDQLPLAEQSVEEITQSQAHRGLSDPDLLDTSTFGKDQGDVSQPEVQHQPPTSFEQSHEPLSFPHESLDNSQSVPAERSDPFIKDTVQSDSTYGLTGEHLEDTTTERTLEAVPLLEVPQQPPISIEEPQVATPLEEPLEYGIKKRKKDKKKKKAQDAAWEEAGVAPEDESSIREVEAMGQPTEPIIEPATKLPAGSATGINLDAGTLHEVEEPTRPLEESYELLTKKSRKDKKKGKKTQALDWAGTPPFDAPSTPHALTDSAPRLGEGDLPRAQTIDLATSNAEITEESLDVAKTVDEASEPSEFSLKKSKKDKKKGKKAQAMSWDEAPGTPLDERPSEREVLLEDAAPVLPDTEIQQPTTPLDSRPTSPPPELAEPEFSSLKKSKRDKKKAKKGQAYEWQEDPIVETPKTDLPEDEQFEDVSDKTVRADDAAVAETFEAPEESSVMEITTGTRGKKSKKDKKGRKSKSLDWDEEPTAAVSEQSTIFLSAAEEAQPLESEPAGGEAPIPEDFEASSSKQSKTSKKSKRAQDWVQAESEQPNAPTTGSLEGADLAIEVETEANPLGLTSAADPEPEEQDYFSVKPNKKSKKSKKAVWDEPIQEVEPLKEIYEVLAQDSQSADFIEGASAQSLPLDELETESSSTQKGKKSKRKGKTVESEPLREPIMEKQFGEENEDVIMPEPVEDEGNQGFEERLPSPQEHGYRQASDDMVMPQEIQNLGASVVRQEAEPREVENMIASQEFEREARDETLTPTVPNEFEYLSTKKSKKDKRKKKAFETWDEPAAELQIKGLDNVGEGPVKLGPGVTDDVQTTATASIEEPEFISKKSKRDKKKVKSKAVSWDEPVVEEVKNEAITETQPEEIDPTTQVLQEIGLQKVDLSEEPIDRADKEVTENIRPDETDPTAQVLHELGLEKVELPDEPTAESTSETMQNIETREIHPSATAPQETIPVKINDPAESGIDVLDDSGVSTSRKGKKNKKSKQRGLSWDEPVPEVNIVDDAKVRDMPPETGFEGSAEDANATIITQDPEFSVKKNKKDKKKSKKSQIGFLEEPLPEMETVVQRGMSPIPELVVEEPESSSAAIIDDEFENPLLSQKNMDEERAKFFDDVDKSIPLGEPTAQVHEREIQEPLPPISIDNDMGGSVVPKPHELTTRGEAISVFEPVARPRTPPPARDDVISSSAVLDQKLDEPARSQEMVAEEDFAGFSSTKKRKKPKRMETFDAEANEAREMLEEQHVERPTSQHANEAPYQEGFGSGQLVRADESHPPLTEVAALLPPIRKRSKKSKKSAGSQYSSENRSAQGELERDSSAGGGGLASMLPQGNFYPSEPLTRTLGTTVDQNLDRGQPHSYAWHESTEPHTFPIEVSDNERPTEDPQIYPSASTRNAENRQLTTPPAEIELSRKGSKKEKRKEKKPEVMIATTSEDNLHDERHDESMYINPEGFPETEALGTTAQLHEQETYPRAALVDSDQNQVEDLPSKRSKRSRKSHNRSPEPIEDEPSIDTKPGVAAGIAAGVALFEGLQRGKSSKKKERKSSAVVDWDDLNPEEHLAGKVKTRRESIEKGARPEELARGDLEIPRLQTRETRTMSQGQQLQQDNRDSGVHFDSPLLHEQSPVTRTSVRDSGYQGAEDSPRASAVPEDQPRGMRAEASKDIEESQVHFLQTGEGESTNASHRTSMAESSDNPLNISIEVDPNYDISVSRPVGERIHGKHRHEPPHDQSTSGQDVSHERSIDHPTQVHSTSRDRSSGLFDSSPSTRDQASAYDMHHQDPATHQVDTLQETSRDMPFDQPRSSSHSMQERIPEQSSSDFGHSTASSLFGGPVGVNSDQVLSPPRTPIESASSRRTRLNTITEHSPEEVRQPKQLREATDIGFSESASKSARRSSTPKTFAQHRVRSPLGTSQLADVSTTAGIAGALSTDKIIAGMSWPSVDEDNHSVDLDKITKPSRETSRNSSGQHDDSTVLPIKSKGGRRSLSGASAASGDSIRAYIRTPDNPRSTSGTPPLRRSDRSISGDLRAAAKRESLKKQAKPYDEIGEREFLPDTAIASSSTYDPVKEKGKGRSRDMADVYEGWGDFHGSPRSPTRPPSMRRRQSMQIIDLEAKLDQLVAENRLLQDAKAKAERNLESVAHDHTQENVALREALQARDEYLAQKDSELGELRASLDQLHGQVAELHDLNVGLKEAGNEFAAEHRTKYSQLETEHNNTLQQWNEASRELDLYKDKHHTLSTGMESIVRQEISVALAKKNAELKTLQSELQTARAQIVTLQQQILTARRASPDPDVPQRDEDYFDEKCQELCQHVKQWVLRYSKFSDSYVCRHSSEVRDEKIFDRFDNAVLDGSDVDVFLADRVRRRDVFMSVVMTMVWEFIFTRYLFGMDREQRSKLKALEKTLGEVGPAASVNRWRATTLGLLSKRPAFEAQRERDTEAVVIEILDTLAAYLPPPSSELKAQLKESLRKVMRAAVALSIEMRCQRAEYIMLPPLQPEYDANGDLAHQVYFNAQLMNERSGVERNNEELMERRAVVQMVLFPLVVKRGGGEEGAEEEIVVCPAQVLIAQEAGHQKRSESGGLRKRVKVGGAAEGNRSVGSFAPSSMDPGLGNVI